MCYRHTPSCEGVFFCADIDDPLPASPLEKKGGGAKAASLTRGEASDHYKEQELFPFFFRERSRSFFPSPFQGRVRVGLGF
jgi:hypothetical protein